MRDFLNHKSKLSPPSGIRKFFDIVRTMDGAISLGVGEPDFNTPEHIIAAAKAALDAGHTKYTPSSGLLPLRKAICEKFKKDNGLDYEPSQIIVSNGAKHSIFNACYAVLDEGDEVIIPQPYWLTYPEVVKVCGGVPTYLPCKKEVIICQKNLY